MAQQLPGRFRIAFAQVREHCPEAAVLRRSLYARGGHIKLRTGIRGWSRGRGGGKGALLLGLDVSYQTILRGLHRVRPVGTEEVVYVVRQQTGVGQHGVVRSVIFCSGRNNEAGLLHLTAEGLGDLNDLRCLPGLIQQGIFNDAAVTVKQRGGLSAEVLENLKAFVADAFQVLVACLRLNDLLGLRAHRGLCR